MQGARKPKLVCIGAQKAGTSWLHEVLGEHPDIWIPPFKELHFFDHKFVEECRKWAPWHVRKSVRETIEKHKASGSAVDEDYLAYLERIRSHPMFNGNWYKFIFSRAPSDAICLDVTPEYSTIPEEGVQFVASFLKQTKFIYIIRDPLSRALSQLQMNATRRKEPLATVREWLDEAKRPVILQRGDYASYVPRWSKAFPKERLMFIPYGRIAQDAPNLLRDIEEFANLSHFTGYTKLTRRIHKTPPIAVPDECVAYLKDKTAPQESFLKQFFGEEFTSLT